MTTYYLLHVLIAYSANQSTPHMVENPILLQYSKRTKSPKIHKYFKSIAHASQLRKFNDKMNQFYDVPEHLT